MLVLLALLILLASIGLGYVVWIRPIESRLDLRSKGALLFIVLTVFGAFWGALPWWFDDESSFAWDLPPLASRMLGAAGFTFVVAALFTLFRPNYDKLRLMLAMIAVYMLPLAVAILAFHLDRFDFSEPVVWGFFPLVAIMCGVVSFFLLNTPSVGLASTPTASETHALSKVWFLAVAAVTVLWGLALFVTDEGFSSEIWAWPGDLLSSRLISVMLLTLATVALYAVLHPSTTAMALAVTATYGLLGALANIWQDFLGKPVKYEYVGVLAIIGVVSVMLLLRHLLERPVPGDRLRTVDASEVISSA
jgi:hypothetical protein